MSTLGTRLLELRKQKGLTQEQLAEKLNVTNQSVSKWEKDINAPDITLLVALADLFETSVDYLLGRRAQAASHHLREKYRSIGVQDKDTVRK